MKEKTEKIMQAKEKKGIIILRRLILSIFLIFVSYEAYMHQVVGGGSNGAPSIHALCPYGALESTYEIFASGTYIQKIFPGTLVILGISILLALLFRRSFCGLICPFGAIQEFFGMIGQKILGKKLIMPGTIDKPLRYLKYGILIITAVGAWTTASLWMDPYDPWTAYGHIFGGFGELLEEYPIGFGILIITILGSILYDRFFCKYLCPMGAFLGIISKFSPNKIKRNEEKCINCGICSRRCPVNIDVSKLDEVSSAECINCQICTLSCPKEGALEIKEGKKVLTPLVLIISVFLIYFGSIGAAKAIGVYNTIPEPIKGGQVISVEDIKGYMTLEEVSKYRNISIEDLYKKLNLPNDISPNTKMKDIKNDVPGFSLEDAKEILK